MLLLHMADSIPRRLNSKKEQLAELGPSREETMLKRTVIDVYPSIHHASGVTLRMTV